MKDKTFTNKDTLAIGLMMFALFLGAGNLIFPPALGQAAGSSVWVAALGFLVTGVGLPILAIIAIAKSGGDLQKVSTRVSPLFGVVFPLIVYLAIGPLFGIPRTGSVAYEIGLVPYLNEMSAPSLFLFTLLFFGTSYWLSLNPAKLVGRVGKILTPILLAVLSIMAFTGILRPLGSPESPTGGYEQFAFFKGFQEGYFTMDAIAALVFGIIIITRMKERGVTSEEETTKKAIHIGLIAGVGLILVYFSLAFLGASSVSSIGYLDNGGAILTGVANELLGVTGQILLSIVITIACLTTSVGLISAFGEYTDRTIKRLPYSLSTAIITLFSLLMANMGLTQLLQFSLPMLIMIYPVAIVLIVLTIFKDLFNESSAVFKGAVAGAAIISIPDGLSVTTWSGDIFHPFMAILPLSALGIAWIIPAVIGGCIGGIITKKHKTAH